LLAAGRRADRLDRCLPNVFQHRQNDVAAHFTLGR
jgi:hypothetical protein